MGIFYATVSIANLAGGNAHETEALVDTGATDSAFPAALLDELGIRPRRRFTYITADGSEVECGYGDALLTITLEDGHTVSGISHRWHSGRTRQGSASGRPRSKF